MTHNVVWETSEGRWSRGHFPTKGHDKIDFSHFVWASCNHETKESAINSAGQEGTPYCVVLYGDNEDQVAEYEQLAQDYLTNEASEMSK